MAERTDTEMHQNVPMQTGKCLDGGGEEEEEEELVVVDDVGDGEGDGDGDDGEGPATYTELPPLCEDDDGLGTMVVDVGSADQLYLESVGPGPSALRICQGAQNAIDERRKTLMGLLDTRNQYEALLVKFICRIESALKENRRKQKVAEMELKRVIEEEDMLSKKKVPLQLFFPPYFRDKYEMVPCVNSEARRRTIDGAYDSLIKEEKKWSQVELTKLHVAVLKSVLEKRLEPFVERRECAIEKLRQCGQETSREDRERWRKRVTDLNRAIQYHLSLPEEEVLSADKTDYSEVDWLKISNIDFLGTRTAKQVRLKWMYEVSPQWNKTEWSVKELRALQSLNNESCIDWSIVAEEMRTQRTSYQCLEKYKTTIGPLLYSKRWTKQEDSRLLVCVKALQNNDNVPWTVVSVFMDGRSQYESRNRYKQFSLPGRNYGKWNMAEDVALLCAVARYGTRDWTSVANMMVSRSRSQCRERWVNIFNKNVSDMPWTYEEDEKLINGIKTYGKGKWSQISSLVPGRSANNCKLRFRSLINTKLKILSDEWDHRMFRSNPCSSRKRRREKVDEHFAKLVNISEVDPNVVGRVLGAATDKDLYSVVPHSSSSLSSSSQKSANDDDEDKCDTPSMWYVDNSLEKWLSLLDQLKITSDMLDETTLSIVRRHLGDEPLPSLNERKRLLSVDEVKVFNKYLEYLRDDDEAKKLFIMESLFDLVERSDGKRWCKDGGMFMRTHGAEQLYKYFDTQLIDVILNHLENGTNPPPLSASIASLDLLDQIKDKMSSLHFESLLLFNPIVPNGTSPNIQLSSEIIDDSEYQLLMLKLRALLYVPMLMDRSIEPESSWQQRQMERNLMRRQTSSTSNSALLPSDQQLVIMSPASRELTLRDIVMGKVAVDASLFASRNIDNVSLNLVVQTLNNTQTEEDTKRSARLDETIESVCNMVKNMASPSYNRALQLSASEPSTSGYQLEFERPPSTSAQANDDDDDGDEDDDEETSRAIQSCAVTTDVHFEEQSFYCTTNEPPPPPPLNPSIGNCEQSSIVACSSAVAATEMDDEVHYTYLSSSSQMIWNVKHQEEEEEKAKKRKAIQNKRATTRSKVPGTGKDIGKPKPNQKSNRSVKERPIAIRRSVRKRPNKTSVAEQYEHCDSVEHSEEMATERTIIREAESSTTTVDSGLRANDDDDWATTSGTFVRNHQEEGEEEDEPRSAPKKRPRKLSKQDKDLSCSPSKAQRSTVVVAATRRSIGSIGSSRSSRCPSRRSLASEKVRNAKRASAEKVQCAVQRKSARLQEHSDQR